MEKIGLFYASTTGNTKDIAETIVEQLDTQDIDLININGCTKDEMKNYSQLIIGVSTWGEGKLQNDWKDYLPHMKEIEFTDKTVAFFGFGDQAQYCENFLDAMGTLYNTVIERGGRVIGSWPTDGYDFDESTALIENEFVGLALDEENQFHLTKERVRTWVDQIKPYFEAA